jgi:FkbM family methyltransferase
MFDRKQYISKPIEIIFELGLIFQSKKVSVVLDIGACEGEDSIRYAKYFQNALIYAFEPRPDNIALIQKNIRDYQYNNIKLENYALSDLDGEVSFYLSSGAPTNISDFSDWDFGNKSSSILAPTEWQSKLYPWLLYSDRVTVKSQRLDNFINEKRLEEIDFVHLDVQGAELKVLEGAGSQLKKVKCIWMEVERIELYKDQPLISDVHTFMKNKGFIRIKSTVGEISGDELYLNSRYFSLAKIFLMKAMIGIKNFLEIKD